MKTTRRYVAIRMVTNLKYRNQKENTQHGSYLNKGECSRYNKIIKQ